MSPTGDDKAYAVARRTLIQGLRALAAFQTGSFILVGAHAVYLRAPEDIPQIPAFTFDADLAVDPAKVGVPRRVLDRLEAAGFVLRGRTPGLYRLTTVPEEEQSAARLDILVPEGAANRWRIEGFNARDTRATMSQPGLELTLFDHSAMEVAPIDEGESLRPVEIEVAGAVALLVAKGWKIGERYAQGAEAFADVTKDVADVYRLLRASDPSDLKDTLRRLSARRELRAVIETGSTYLRDLCGQRGAGLQLLGNALGRSSEAEIMLESLEVLATEFFELASTSLR